MKTLLNLIGFVVASVITMNAYAAEYGTCDAQRISYASSSSQPSVSTQSETFVTVPDMWKTINIPGTTTTCVAINFSAVANADFSPAVIVIRATRDGVECDPGGVQLVGGEDDAVFSSYAYNFICRGVTPGNHTFRIQWLSPENFEVFISRRSMVIHHR